MTKTLTSRGGALSALALMLALAAPAAAFAQDMPERQPDYSDPPPMRIERAQPSRAERPVRTERPAVRSEPRAPRFEQPRTAEAPQQRSFPTRAERPARAERAERRGNAEQRPNRDGFGTDVMRRAQRASAETERRADTFDQRPDRGPRGDGRRENPRGWQGRDGGTPPPPVNVGRGGDARADQPVGGRIGQGDGRRDGRRDGDWRDGRRNGDWRDGRRDGDWRDGRRDGDWRDGRRDGDWRDGDRRDYRRDRRNWRRDDWRWSYGGWNGWDRNDFRRWDNRWRSNRDYDWNGFRRGNRFQFHPGPYFAPYRSHRYNRLNIGFFLDSLFFQPRFFINDPWSYRLPPVYGPYQWVRYYDDVVLVDIYTGEVVDVIHDFFW
ncbi:MAG: RcnB family protein [Erythrobacter sp.]|jgi:hypothetical protein|uniref:RcnB family protein n=1 Tax=Erythrobacter sp. TaxID=1042 RepID=UPI002B4754E6|nr:RcnB family protein [Erythrobacter sp.]WRH70560.1 MAG: RcnB family protein [Erythrobacter sp.]